MLDKFQWKKWIDPLHPSVLAEKYHRSYRPFLLGGPGSQSLAQYLGMQGTAKQLKDKKAVVIDHFTTMVY